MHRPSSLLILWLSLLLLGGLSCKEKQNIQNEIALARVSSQTLYLNEVMANTPSYKLSSDSAKAVSDYVDNWVQSQVLLLECERLSLDRDPKVARNLQKAQNEVLIRSLEETMLNSSQLSQVDESEIVAFYQQNPQLFILQEEFVTVDYFSHPNSNTTANAREKVIQGRDFESVILSLKNETSKEASIQQYHQFLSRTQFNEIAPSRFINRTLSIGDVTDLYRSGSNHAFLRVSGLHQKGDIAGLESVRARIHDWLVTEKQKKNLTAYRRSLYLKAQSNNQIEVYSP